MDTQSILRQLEYPTAFPEAAVRAAIANRDEMVPHLLFVLERVVSEPDKILEDGASMTHLFAMFLLAQSREPRAYPLLVRLGRLPSKTLDGLLGDIVTEDFDAMLACVCDTQFGPIKELVEDSQVDEYVRSAALNALLKLWLDGRLSRQQLVDYHRKLLHGGLEPSEFFIWSAPVVAAMRIHPEENLDALRRAFEDGLVDPSFVSQDDLEQTAARSLEEVEAESRRRKGGLINDVIRHMSWWACFKPSPATKVTSRSAPPQSIRSSPTAIQAAGPKIGRDAPCPCGSDKKYKKCCGKVSAASN